MTNELEIILWSLGALAIINVLSMALFVLFAKLPNSPLRELICAIIYELDKFADQMENNQKRAEAIRQINEVLGWKRIMIPEVVIGWVIDAEVAAIRKMQETTKTPDLHEKDKNS